MPQPVSESDYPGHLVDSEMLLFEELVVDEPGNKLHKDIADKRREKLKHA
ncbi:MAG: hypothetical protein IJG80_07525 [Selenomonadaceae bacterium]|nr:hypothetical protein [Selenomonadaceae bacterium]